MGAQIVGESLEVTIEDTGVGIGPEDLPHLGDPYFQARSTCNRYNDGAGLGLSIVKGLLALHGGEMLIDSRLGKGTRVTVHLPVDCERLRKSVGPLASRPVSPSAKCAINGPAGVSSGNRMKLSA